MGRLFNDEDEAKMIKLTEDLTAWMNKYAPTFEDPESMLFEITTPLITAEMEAGIPVKEPTPAAPIAEPIQEPEPEPMPETTTELPESAGSISISFSFGDNGDWFTFEQTMFPEPQEE